AGFDGVGLAAGRWLRVTARVAPAAAAKPVAIERSGTLRALDTAPEADLLYRGFVAACRRARREVPAGLALNADSDIPVARGLGSSAAATVAGAAAAAALLDLELGPPDLAELASGPDGHPGNRAPAVVHGLAHADPRLLAAGLDDVLHVPFRRALVPGYDEVTRAARDAGAYGATLSGSGPTIVGVVPAHGVRAVGDAMVRAWGARGTVAEAFHADRPAGGYEIG